MNTHWKGARRIVPLCVLAVVLALAGCSGSEIRAGARSSIPLVRITAPSEGQTFTAQGAAVDVPATVFAQLPQRDDAVQMLLDGAPAGKLDLDKRTFVFGSVTIGVHRLGAQALTGEGSPYTNPEAADSVNIVVTKPCQTDAECDDNDECTLDRCQDGLCRFLVSTSPACVGPDAGAQPDATTAQVECKNDGECKAKYGDQLGACRTVYCDTSVFQCVFVDFDDGTPCDDGDACTVGDACQAGQCQGGAALDCNDDNPCTDDQCDPQSGCVHQDNGQCPCIADSDCPDDGDLCNGVPRCVNYQCVVDDATIPKCVDDNPDDCLVNTCVPDTGECVLGPAPDAAACDDGNACTDSDACNAGACEGTPVDCNDDDVCTADACDPASGCVYTPVPGPCDDGDVCTLDDTCDNGTCAAGSPLNCDDENLCTVDSCDPTTGCVHDPAPVDGTPCDDDDACTENETCNGGLCVVVLVDCDDGDACTDDSCDPATGCVHTAIPNCIPGCQSDADCDDGDACTADTCDTATGACDHAAVDCDDGDACTDDSCDPATGCVHTAIPNCVAGCQSDADCDDGDACTADTCDTATGACDHAAVDCDDGDACTNDGCDPQSGCTHDAVDCDDGDACTDDSCDSTAGCTHSATDCDDGNDCTDDSCDSASGCVNDPNTNPCDDGDPCTANDTCEAGACAGMPILPGTGDCPLPQDVICAVEGAAGTQSVCLLKLARASIDTPEPAALQFTLAWDDTKAHIVEFRDEVCADPADPTTCVDVPVPPSPLYPSGHTASLAPDPDPANWAGSGQVLLVNLTDPASPITDAYLDTMGAIVGDPTFLKVVIETDADVTAADPVLLSYAEVVASTADAKPMDEVVQDGIIIVSFTSACTPPDCDDGNPCTLDDCDQASGQCKHIDLDGVTCDDGDPCTQDDTCVAGTCQATPVDCNDGDPCTTDSCDPQTGACLHEPIPGCSGCVANADCDDGDACTDDLCDLGQCTHAAVDCDDGVSCTTDACDATAGCTHTADDTACDDGDACTADTCDVAADCQHAAVDCDDGVSCTTDACDATAGCTHAADDTACDDGDACTADTCDVAADCQHVAVDCDDGDACTTDSCDAAAGCQHAAVDCDDGVSCTADACDATAGCTHTADDTACDDGDACTTDTCDMTADCQHAAVNCDDGDVCNGVEDCDPQTGCVAGTPLDCNDGVSCTTDACDATTGCTHTADDTACDDGDACTTDSCDAVAGCQHAAVDCDDGDACTTDTCDAVGGCQHAAVDCDDGVSCTVDACDATTGCTHTADDAVCDDGNICTDDACDAAAGGCTNTPNTAPCDDGDFCTIDDTCVAGTCAGDPNPVCDNVVCAVSGTAGSEVTCDLKLARLSMGEPLPAGVQFTLQFDSTQLSPTRFTDVLCLPPGVPGCTQVEVDTPPSTVSTGHTVNLGPADIAAWSTSGSGSVLLVNPSDPTAPVTEAYFDDTGVLQGDPVFLTLHATLLQDIDPASPALLFASGIVGTTASATQMEAFVKDEVMVVFLPSNETCTTAQDCDDGDPCTTEYCASGKCAHLPVPGCSAANACCVAGAGPGCGDTTCESLVCAADPTCCSGTWSAACAALGKALCSVCGATPACTADADCDDAVACTVDTCDLAAGGTCVHTPDDASCDDGNPCTTDACDATTGCTHTAIAGCAACATDSDCDDGVACTVDTCDVATGTCANTPSDMACDDGDACNGIETCDAVAGCQAGTAVSCDDGISCTNDACDPATGACSHLADDTQCDDGNPCNGTETCDAAAGCQAGTPVNCDDGVACTVDSCDPASGGCIHTPDDSVCDNGNACDGIEMCDGTQCVTKPGTVPGCGNGILEACEECDDGNNIDHDGCSATCLIESCTADAQCDDGNVCTTDTCGYVAGCIYSNNDGVSCDDGDACTTGTTCSSGQCGGGTSVVCNDGIDCTTDSCDPVVGCVATENDAACDDGNPCTTNLCDATSGCLTQNVADGTSCDDGDACTTGTTCTAGVCAGGTPVTCDDGNACTADTCDPVNGCVFTPTPGVACDDGDPCTNADQCQQDGSCAGNPIQGGSCGTAPTKVCELAGTAGTELVCPLQVAAAADLPANYATGIQFNLMYHPNVLTLVGFYTDFCIPAVGCFEVKAAGSGAQPLPSGHTVSTNPQEPSDANTQTNAGAACVADADCGTLACIGGFCASQVGTVIVNVSNPSAHLSDAYLDATATLVGDPTFMRAKFTAAVDVTTPEGVWLTNVVAPNKDAQTLNSTIDASGVIITELPAAP